MARQNHKRDNLSFVNQDAIEYLKHTDKIFDVLIMSHILEHLDNPSEFLKSVFWIVQTVSTSKFPTSKQLR